MSDKKSQDRAEFRRKIDGNVHYANGYYYVGDYQPVTNTGRYPTREAAINYYQMDCYDADAENNEL